MFVLTAADWQEMKWRACLDLKRFLRLKISSLFSAWEVGIYYVDDVIEERFDKESIKAVLILVGESMGKALEN